jgi:hypothetical protein
VCSKGPVRRAGTYRKVHFPLLFSLYDLMTLGVCEGVGRFGGSADRRALRGV